MTTRRRWHFSALAAVALLVASCGGGDVQTPLATRVIMFGDSLSDIGTYTPATQIPLGQAPGVKPFFGGKFTTNTFSDYTATGNTSTSNTWVEWIAGRLGVPITPAEVGFVTTRVPCPAAALAPSNCTGYAQGGARVTDPNGIGKTSGALTIPIVAQIASHNTRALTGFRTGFDGSDIVFVYGGNNDVFIQFGAVGAAAITPAQASAAVQQAGTELANLVKNEILAKGATRVAVMTLPDASATPGFAPLPAANKALLTQLSADFNTALLAGLSGSAARIIDARALATTTLATAASLGITNTTTAACDPVKIAAFTGNRITDGSSLFCNASPAALFAAPLPVLNALKVAASASTYLFADSVHPTTAGHKIFSDQVWQAMKDFGWVPLNL
jgi:outer membrane lipase/esterase